MPAIPQRVKGVHDLLNDATRLLTRARVVRGLFPNALGTYLPQARVHTRVLFLEGFARFKSQKDTTETVILSFLIAVVFMGQSRVESDRVR